MNDLWFPTEEELEVLAPEVPDFDLRAVKRRTLQRTRSRSGRRTVLRGVLVAAMICLLSVSALAAANPAARGRVMEALGIARTAVQEKVPSVPEMERPAPEAVPEPVFIPEPEPAPVYEMDEQVAEHLQVTEPLRQTLQSAGQVVQQTVENDGVKITLEQTVGDDHLLCALVRAEFPEEVTLTADMGFREVDVNASFRSWKELSRGDHAITWLLTLDAAETIPGREITATLRDFGHIRDTGDRAYALVPAGQATSCFFVPTGSGSYSIYTTGPSAVFRRGDTEYPAPENWEQAVEAAGGALVQTWEDGVVSVLVHRDRQALVEMGAVPRVTFGEDLDPAFETVISGTWIQTWIPDYAPVSRTWTLDRAVGGLTVNTVTVSPLSLELEVSGSAEAWADMIFLEKPMLEVRTADGMVLEPVSTAKYGMEPAAVRVRFAGAIDPASVTAVVFYGTEILLT